MSYDNADMCECGGRFGDHFAGRNQCPRRKGVFRLVEPDPWHPASQPPSDDRPVLVLVSMPKADSWIDIGHFKHGWFPHLRGVTVTLWRELPEPPKGGTV